MREGEPAIAGAHCRKSEASELSSAMPSLWPGGGPHSLPLTSNSQSWGGQRDQSCRPKRARHTKSDQMPLSTRLKTGCTTNSVGMLPNPSSGMPQSCKASCAHNGVACPRCTTRVWHRSSAFQMTPCPPTVTQATSLSPLLWLPIFRAARLRVCTGAGSDRSQQRCTRSVNKSKGRPRYLQSSSTSRRLAAKVDKQIPWSTRTSALQTTLARPCFAMCSWAINPCSSRRCCSQGSGGSKHRTRDRERLFGTHRLLEPCSYPASQSARTDSGPWSCPLLGPNMKSARSGRGDERCRVEPLTAVHKSPGTHMCIT